MINLVYPWDDKNFKGTKEELFYIYNELKKRKYKISVEKPTDIYLLKIIDKLVPILLQDKWLLITSNSNDLLENLTNYLSLIYSLTSTYTCVNTSSEVIQLLLVHSDEPLEQLKRTSLLFWQYFLDVPKYMNSCIGSITEMMRVRASRKCSTVFTYLYVGDSLNKSEIQIINNKIKDTFGQSFAAILNSKISIVDVPVKMDNPWNKVIKI